MWRIVIECLLLHRYSYSVANGMRKDVRGDAMGVARPHSIANRRCSHIGQGVNVDAQ